MTRPFHHSNVPFLTSVMVSCVLAACGGGSSDEPIDTASENGQTALLGKGGVKGKSNYQLSVSLSGTGSVTSSPAGIDCGTDCSEAYAPDTSVALTAVSAADSIFVGWTGDCSGDGATCTVPMTATRNVVANFVAAPGPAPAPAPAPAPEPVPAPVPIGSTITSVTIENTASFDQTDIPATVGQVFAQGAVLPSDTLAAKLADGSIIPLQLNVKAKHADGSVRHGVISARLPRLAIGQTQTIGITKVSTGTATATATTPQSLIDSGFAASVNVTVNGVVYNASADALLKAGAYKTWISGPIANEWLVSAPLKSTQGSEHPHLAARFAIRSYTGMNKTKVDVTIENSWAYEPNPQNYTYDVQVLVGGSPVYSKAGLTHYHHARWRKEFWWGLAPQVHIAHNAAYLISTKAIPKFDPTLTISSTALSALKAGWSGTKTEPMGPGQANPAMPNTGGRPDIGLLPGWAAMYVLSGDKGAKDVTFGTANLAGSWSAHYRDKRTDRPVSLVDYPYMTILGNPGDTYNPATKQYESFPACGGTCTNPNIADSSHQPAFSFVPYLVTGDYYHLEELQFWAMWNLVRYNPGYREYGKGLVKSDQVRGQAWSMRALSEAAYITPDSDPMKAQFETFLSNNLDWYNANYTTNASANGLGVVTNGAAVVYTNSRGIAPWQDDFFTSAIGRAAELGYAKAKPLLAWKAKFPVGRMTDPGFCWISGSIYSLNIRETSSGPFYGSLGQAYQASVSPTVASLACGSDAMASALGLRTGEMTGYSASVTGYPSNMQPALAYSVDSGIANGATAWQVFMNRTVKPDYSTSPQFAIVPR